MTESMDRIRDEVERQVGVRESVESEFDPDTLVRFSDDLPDALSAEERDRLIARARELEPWLQGPFLLGGDLVVGGLWRIDTRWANLDEQLPADLSGISILDVGSNAGYDPFMFKRRGAGKVLACEPFEFIEQAHFLESIYKTGADFQRIGWQELDAGEDDGSFDLVHCHGVLYHEVDPMGLLTRLFEMTAPGGTLPARLDDVRRTRALRPLAVHPARLLPRRHLVVDPGAGGAEVDDRPRPVSRSKVVRRIDRPAGEFPTINGYFRATRLS